jgi:hypothetical protein
MILAGHFSAPGPFLGVDDEFSIDWVESVRNDAGPSLPIILFSTASGIGSGVIAFYLTYRVFQLTVQLSAAFTTLGVLFALGISGVALSSLTGSRAGLANILFSCGLLLLALMFFALCTLLGAIVAALVLVW